MSGMTIGVLGLGSIGRRHARNLLELGYTVIGYDPGSVVPSLMGGDLNVELVERPSLFARSDAVIIASPNRYHLEDVAEAIRSRRPALVEKPLGHDHAIARDLVHQASGKGVMVAVAHNLRFRSVVGAAHRIISAGAVGTPLWARFHCGSWLPEWRPGTDYRTNYAADRGSGGVIFDVIHELDLACHLLGPAAIVSAAAINSGILEIETEDVADMNLRHKSGCQTSVHVDYVSQPSRRHFAVGGSDALLEADLRSGRVTVTGPNDEKRIQEIHPVDLNAEYVAELRDFLGAVERNESPSCTARDALPVLEIACRAREMAGLPFFPVKAAMETCKN